MEHIGGVGHSGMFLVSAAKTSCLTVHVALQSISKTQVNVELNLSLFDFTLRRHPTFPKRYSIYTSEFNYEYLQVKESGMIFCEQIWRRFHHHVACLNATIPSINANELILGPSK